MKPLHIWSLVTLGACPHLRGQLTTVACSVSHPLSSRSQLLGGEVVAEVYRLLKRVESTEEDPLTRSHAQAALGELDSAMRQFLFPEQTLSKKISVLNFGKN